MEIPDLGEICLNVEASKVSAAFAQVTDVLRHLNEKQEELANQLTALSEKVTGAEDLQKQLTTLEEGNAKSIEQLKSYTHELEGLKLEEQPKTMELHSRQFEKTLELLEQSDLKWKEQEAKLAQLSIDSRQSCSSLEKTAADICGLRSTLGVHKNAVAEVQAAHAEYAERFSQMEEVQYKLQESVASKYQKLWQDVVEALERFNAAELSNYQQELQKCAQHSEQRVQQLVSYALNLVAQTARDRRRVDLKRAVVLRWKEAAWLGARQRMACRVLVHFFRSHSGKHFQHVKHVTAWESEISRIKQEFQKCLPDMDKVVENLVQPAVTAIEEQRIASEYLTQRLHQHIDKLATHTRGLQDTICNLSDKAENTSQSVEQLRGDFENVLARRNTDEERFSETQAKMKEVIEQMSRVARQDEMQGIMKDILLIWTAVKQLDATKADKRDIDSLATETSTRSQQQTLQSQVSRVEEKMHDTNGRSRLLNFMLGVLMRFMEDVVKKILALDPSRSACSQASSGGTVIRTGGGWLPRPVSTSVNRFAHSPPPSPRCRHVSPNHSSVDSATSHTLLGGATGTHGEKHVTAAGGSGRAGRRWRALPASRSFENIQAITLGNLNDDKRGTQEVQSVTTQDWKSTTGASKLPECDEINNPAVRAFCEWVEQVRDIFEAPATLCVCTAEAATMDAPSETVVASARTTSRQRTSALEVRGNEAHASAEYSHRPGTAGPGMQPPAVKQHWSKFPAVHDAKCR